jgi:hypothetical protein
MRAGAPGHIGHVSADSAIRCAASRATLKNSSPSPSLRSSYQAAASSSSASASASSASLTTGFQSVGDALLSFVPGDKCGRAVGDGLCATVELLDPSLFSTRFGVAVEAEQVASISTPVASSTSWRENRSGGRSSNIGCATLTRFRS